MKTTNIFKILLTLALFVLLTNDKYAQNNFSTYGYFSSRVEKIFSAPKFEEGVIGEKNSNLEWQYPYFNLMMQNDFAGKYRIFVNLSGGGENALENIEVRNVWGEYIYDSWLKLRVGKTYRKFGTFNEILDAVPTYFGIEPPQYINQEHEILQLYPRLTSFIIHGAVGMGEGSLNYGISFDKGFSESFADAFPYSIDLNYDRSTEWGNIKLGAAFYSTGGTIAFEEGEEEEEEGEFKLGNGTFPWMEKDEFSVLSAYFETNLGDLTIQGGYLTSDHNSERNAEALEDLLSEKSNRDQVERFLLEKSGEIEDDNIIEDVDYTINAWYLRAGYSFYTAIGEFGPYAQLDYYKNPESVALLNLDEEHDGVPDNGQFQVLTFGLLYRPIPTIAVKFDLGYHMYDFHNKSVGYPEFKLDFSFVFGQF